MARSNPRGPPKPPTFFAARIRQPLVWVMFASMLNIFVAMAFLATLSRSHIAVGIAFFIDASLMFFVTLACMIVQDERARKSVGDHQASCKICKAAAGHKKQLTLRAM